MSRARSRLVVIAVAVAAVIAGAGTAAAVDRECPTGQIWSPNLGACVKKPAVKKRSPEERYYAAIDLIEGKHGVADPAKAATLLGPACDARHGASCTLLAYLHLGGRLGPAAPARAIDYYQRGCALGDPDGCIAAAEVYAKGLLGEPDAAAAIAPLVRACELGSGRGCYELAEKHAEALGVPRDDAKAGELYARARERLTAECPKSGPSCYQLGFIHTFGKGVPVDYARAREVFTRGCEARSGLSCYAVGYLIQRGFGAPPDEAAALPYHERACDQFDSADGCHDAGAILADRPGADPARLEQLATRACQLSTEQCDLKAYLLTTGKTGPKDEKLATETYLEACKAGNALACSAAASRIAHGEGVPADGALATSIWERACGTGSGQDCYQAGVAHRDGELVKADKARAFELFTTGCLRKSAIACEDAAEMTLTGADGTGKQDGPRALGLFQAGCDLGRAESCTRLGDVHRDGEGVPANPHLAVAAYAKGCQAGDGAACAATARMRQRGALGNDLLAAFGEHARACQLGEGGSCHALDTLAGPAGADAATRSKAAALLAAACDTAPHVEDACTALAQSHAWGGLAGQDPKRALAVANASCGRGYRPACLLVADYALLGIGVVPNAEAARQRYAALCDQDLPEGCWKLGNVLSQAGKHDDAVRLFRRACEEGLAAGCNSFGFCLYTGQGATWNVGEAAAAYERACELGDEYGCANVGELHQFGIGVPIDLAAAASAYGRACDEVAVAGCARLGELVERGEGGRKRDAGAARDLYVRGCDAGAPEACRALAALDERGGKGGASTIAKLYQRAYDLALEQAKGNPYYAYVIGTFHRDGIAVTRDAKEAAVWFDKACEGRDPIGCLAAGEAHLTGAGVPRDETRAAAWFDRACAAGVDRACARAAEAKRGVPLSGGKGCACRSGDDGSAGGVIAIAGVVVCVLARRRRAAA